MAEFIKTEWLFYCVQKSMYDSLSASVIINMLATLLSAETYLETKKCDDKETHNTKKLFIMTKLVCNIHVV